MIIYISSVETAFVIRDLEMIRGNFKVIYLTFTDNPVLLPFFSFLQFFQLVLLLPFTSKYICFFSGYHTVIPVILGRLFKKEVLIQCGGTDAMNLPHINYGNYRKKWLRMATVFSFKNCTTIIPVSEALVRSNYDFDPKAPKAQGLLNLVPKLKTPIKVIHNGFDVEFWSDVKEKESNTFVSVATGISKKNRAMVKGIDLILELAKHFKHYNFALIGDENFKSELKNVKVYPKMGLNAVKEKFQTTQFYLQLSASEGFPNALAEAMLCGCIPIGSKVGGIPEIIGDAGFLLSQKDLGQLFDIFNSLEFANKEQLRRSSRYRIMMNYSYEKRKEKLLNILS